ncbi:retrovirus-related pol polyprotein from transposon tnt 1-94 [Elysia marginata]|uniref:Retrovirus-related pol polyprotein from transposon tnt 1-94 n=1 Tax=Elysia marginata TaxID=1093978 RepID=A0AAV4FUA9_9GAST|nr:retrovirus-related pol polyprotein from transposon tnt 1-94 [Elysia marginata]
MTDCKPKYTPCAINLNKFLNEPAEKADARLHKEIVGSLIYIMTATRPDLCYVVTRLSQYMAEPTKNHMVAAKHVLRYLKATIDQKLTYVKTSNVENIKLVGACDADWGNCADDRKSITGYGFRVTRVFL